MDDEYPLAFTRVYGTQDDRARSFGVGAQHSLDTFLVGEMGVYVELNLEDGGKVRFDHVHSQPGQTTDTYRAPTSSSIRFSRAEAVYENDVWRVTTGDGWTYLFPYRPKARTTQVTVLTGVIDPSGHKSEMVRDDSGDLLSVITPSGKWLHFQYGPKHRIDRIRDSQGRSVQYDYDASGRLSRVTDSTGRSEIYTYNDRNEMLSVQDATGSHLLSNEFSSTGLLTGETVADGRHLEYGYSFSARNVIHQSFLTDPNGLITYFDYSANGYFQSLPTALFH